MDSDPVSQIMSKSMIWSPHDTSSIKLDFISNKRMDMAYYGSRSMGQLIGKPQIRTQSEAILLASTRDEACIMYAMTPDHPDWSQAWIQRIQDDLSSSSSVPSDIRPWFDMTRIEGHLTDVLSCDQEESKSISALVHELEKRYQDPTSQKEFASEQMSKWKDHHNVSVLLKELSSGRRTFQSMRSSWTDLQYTVLSDEKAMKNIHTVICHLQWHPKSGKNHATAQIFTSGQARFHIFRTCPPDVSHHDAAVQKSLAGVADALKKHVESKGGGEGDDLSKRSAFNIACVARDVPIHATDTLLVAGPEFWMNFDRDESLRMTLKADTRTASTITGLAQLAATSILNAYVSVGVCRIK